MLLLCMLIFLLIEVVSNVVIDFDLAKKFFEEIGSYATQHSMDVLSVLAHRSLISVSGVPSFDCSRCCHLL